MSNKIKIFSRKEKVYVTVMKRTKVPILVSGFLWVTNIGKLQVAKGGGFYCQK